MYISLHVTVMQILFSIFCRLGLILQNATTGKQLTKTQNFALFRKKKEGILKYKNGFIKTVRTVCKSCIT
jgi:hypothetical protein